ncbi:MAG: hypothetical protein EHM61_25555 [Acidobacteria bacterium]|nr:MAG: hypothetical protein EHM61_25555 [Acidobacteriota bacterium]
MTNSKGTIFFFMVLIDLCCLAHGQAERRWEVGAQYVLADFEGIGEAPGGFGGRCVYNLTEHLAVDGEVDYFPNQTTRGRSPLPGIRAEVRWPHGETELFAGLRAGFRFNGVGFFAKARPGLMLITDHQARRFVEASKIRPALDLGGILEFYPSSRLIIRVELGRVFIPLGDHFVSAVAPSPVAPTASWNLQGGIGFAVRF